LKKFIINAGKIPTLLQKISITSLDTRDSDGVHLDRLDRVIVAGLDGGDLVNEIHTRDDLAEDRVFGLTRAEEVEEVVVGNVHEELGTTRVRLTGVGHGESARRVGDLSGELIRDVTTVLAGNGLALLGASEDGEGGAVLRTTGTSPVGVGVLGVRATELVHEVRDDAVEVNTVVVAGLAQVDEVGGGDRHLAEEDLGLEAPHGGVELGNRVWHFVCGFLRKLNILNTGIYLILAIT